MIEVNDENFYQQVIQKSKEIPIVVDFWAPWCQPCLMLGPILEKLEKEYQGKFILAKLNVEENREISSYFNIASIPSVKLFKDGKIIDEFVGLLPESQIRKFLKKVKPSEIEDIIKKGDQYYNLGKLQDAKKEYEKGLEMEPGDEQIKYKIGLILFKQNNLAEAKRYLKSIENQSEAKKLLDIIYFKEIPSEDTEKLKEKLNRNPDDLELRLNLANQYAKNGDYKEAMDEYLIILEKDKKYKDEVARKCMLRIFNILGQNSLVEEYREKLARILF